MARVVVIHWKPAAAEATQRGLVNQGHRVELIRPEGGKGLAPYRAAPPDAFVIDLSRLPSHGREVAVYLRRTKSTREVPLVFLGGDPAKADRLREALPDAQYVRTWRGVSGAIRRAKAAPPRAAVVPPTIAGYSGTPLVKKLGIKPTSRVVLVGAPQDIPTLLADRPPGSTLVQGGRGAGDLVVLFATTRAELAKRLPGALARVDDPGRLWIAWPKKASGQAKDLAEPGVRAAGLAAGWVDFKICAIDATWSGLCFARPQHTQRRAPTKRAAAD